MHIVVVHGRCKMKAAQFTVGFQQFATGIRQFTIGKLQPCIVGKELFRVRLTEIKAYLGG